MMTKQVKENIQGKQRNKTINLKQVLLNLFNTGEGHVH